MKIIAIILAVLFAAPTWAGSCDGVSSLTLRNAKVKKQLIRCYKESDVRSIYGSPDSVSRSTYGSTQWAYHFNNNDDLYVYFENGRVTDWSTYDSK